MNNDHETTLKDSNGNYFSLELTSESESIPSEQFIPDFPEFPDACRYVIHSKETDQWLIIENIAKADERIKELKKIHGIYDPWDDDPDYFKDVPISDPEAAFEKLTDEEKAKVREVLNWGKRGE